MSTKRLWLIAGGAAALFVIAVVLILIFVPRSDASAPGPTPSSSTPSPSIPVPTPTASATPTPSPSLTAQPVLPTPATCESTSTDPFRAQAAANGWISWETQNQPVGAKPFENFPNGSPEGTIVCRWGADPQSGTDNVLDLAWAPIDSENAAASIQSLVEAGLVRTDDDFGVHLATADGQNAYLFTGNDVRWAPMTTELDFITAPPGR